MGSLGGCRFDDLYGHHLCCVYTVVDFLSKLMEHLFIFGFALLLTATMEATFPVKKPK